MLDPLTWAMLAFVAVVFWVPQAAVAAASLLGLRQSAPPTGRRPWILAGAGCAVSALGVAGGVLMLYGYVLGTSMGGYTSPAETAAFNVVTLSPIAVSTLASLLAALRLALLLRRRR